MKEPDSRDAERKRRADAVGYTCGPESEVFFCRQNHIRKTRIGVLEKFPRCEECHFAKVVSETIMLVEKKWNLKHVGELPARTKDTTIWECQNGAVPHTFSNNAYRLFRFGKPCAVCAKQRRTIAQISSRSPKKIHYEQLEKATGYQLIGDTPLLASEKSDWMCPKGHRVRISYVSLKNRGRGCRFCSIQILGDKTRKDMEDYLRTGENCGLRPIFDTAPRQNKLKVQWQCIKDAAHTFRESLENLREIAAGREGRRRGGCIYCFGVKTINGKQVSESQQRVFEMLKCFTQYGPRRQNYKLGGNRFFPDMVMKGPKGKSLLFLTIVLDSIDILEVKNSMNRKKLSI